MHIIQTEMVMAMGNLKSKALFLFMLIFTDNV